MVEDAAAAEVAFLSQQRVPRTEPRWILRRLEGVFARPWASPARALGTAPFWDVMSRFFLRETIALPNEFDVVAIVRGAEIMKLFIAGSAGRVGRRAAA